jgi:hypothetical protein
LNHLASLSQSLWKLAFLVRSITAAALSFSGGCLKTFRQTSIMNPPNTCDVAHNKRERMKTKEEKSSQHAVRVLHTYN